MAQQYKIDKVNFLKDVFSENANYIFNSYSGLNVSQMTELRNKLREFKSKFMVIKNNYVKRALKEQDIEDFGDNLSGTTAVAFANDDVNEVLKILFNYQKSTTLSVKGGWVSDSLYSKEQLEDLSKLPGKKQLIAMLMSTMQAPVSNFVYACNDIIGRLVRVTNAVAESKK